MLKHKWKIYKWKLNLKDGRSDTFNMPYLLKGTLLEPTEEDIKSFLKNFRPSLYVQFISATWESGIEYED